MSYVVGIRRSAQKELDAIPSPHYEKLEEKLLSLRDTPRPVGCKILEGTEKNWRVRVADYRIVYEIDDRSQTITVIKIGHRSRIYR